jgi:hypothetical protein
VGGIFDDYQSKFLGQLANATHLDDLPAVMNRNDGAQLLPPLPSSQGNLPRSVTIDVEIALLTINQQRFRIEVPHEY